MKYLAPWWRGAALSAGNLSGECVNNSSPTLMLFQENARKELLERNKRREGPILEVMRSCSGKKKNFYDLALSRLSNPNWFKKGNTSAKISIIASAQLQQSYMKAVLLHNELNLKSKNPDLLAE